MQLEPGLTIRFGDARVAIGHRAGHTYRIVQMYRSCSKHLHGCSITHTILPAPTHKLSPGGLLMCERAQDGRCMCEG